MDDECWRWPFFDERHRTLAAELRTWAATNIPEHHEGDVGMASRDLVRLLGDAGWLCYAVPAPYGGADAVLDVRTLCIMRETLARHTGLADFAFAMQGLGAGPISLFGSDALKAKYLPAVARGEHVAAFAISERDAGSDVAAMQTTARQDGDAWVIDGEKTWISNGGIADHYVVFCRFADRQGEFVALVVERDDPGLSASPQIETLAPHPLATITLTNCRVPGDRLVGPVGKGLRVALGTLDVFRTTVGAAALGFARRAQDEALAHVSERRMFGQRLRDFQLTQAKLADMETAIDASALLVYRAAWTRDQGAERVTREAAIAKRFATEQAQHVIDDALQLLGGRGVVTGNPVEALYREIRALRIYEGTSEVQQLIIAGQALAAYDARQVDHG